MKKKVSSSVWLALVWVGLYLAMVAVGLSNRSTEAKPKKHSSPQLIIKTGQYDHDDLANHNVVYVPEKGMHVKSKLLIQTDAYAKIKVWTSEDSDAKITRKLTAGKSGRVKFAFDSRPYLRFFVRVTSKHGTLANTAILREEVDSSLLADDAPSSASSSSSSSATVSSTTSSSTVTAASSSSQPTAASSSTSSSATSSYTPTGRGATNNQRSGGGGNYDYKPVPSTGENETVYVSANIPGRYHKDPNCRGLQRYGGVQAMTLAQAQARGYTAFCAYERYGQ